MQLKAILQQVPDPRGKQGQDYKLWSILSLIIRVAVVRPARNEGGVCSWAQPEPAAEGGAGLCSRNDRLVMRR